MTDLNRLKVSLTKHGAHKAAILVEDFPKDQILDNTWEKHKEISIDRAQTKKNLSVDSKDKVPSIWDDVKQLGKKEIENLVFVAIVFSHHKLIQTMITANTGEMKGTVVRGEIINSKEYSNFAHTLNQLGLAPDQPPKRVSYNLSRLFENSELPILVARLLALKLRTAGWNEETNIVDECIKLKFHKALGISPEYFREWLEGEIDEVPQQDEADDLAQTEFKFKSGHNPKKERTAPKAKPKSTKKAEQLHDRIQDALYSHLVEIHGKDSVGTEVDSGYGGYVDVVVQQNGGYIFYEIKTDNSVKMCIRQAISQLKEYAYWPNKENAKQLIIVTKKPLTKNGQQYLDHLRTKFGLPVYYQQFDLKNEQLCDIY